MKLLIVAMLLIIAAQVPMPMHEMSKWDFVLNNPEWIAVLANGLFAIVTVGIIIWQAVEARSAARAAQKNLELIVSKDRARISVSPKHEDFFDFSYVPTHGIAEAGIKITQYGPTNAFNVVGQISLVIQSSKDPPPMQHMGRMNLLDVIPGNAAPFIESFLLPESITQDLLDRIESGEAHIHLFGVISYTDVFGVDHRTPFRFIWVSDYVEVPDKDSPQFVHDRGWEKHGPEEDNKAT